MKAGMGWPIGVATILALTVAANIVVMRIANDDPSFSVEPDYYRKAVAWDSTMARRAESAALGWTATVTLEAEARAAAPTTVAVALLDTSGAPVREATVAVTLIHNADAGRPLSVRLSERAPGTYEGSALLAFPGRWEVRIAATRGAERFELTTHTDLLRREAPAGAATAAPIALPLPTP